MSGRPRLRHALVAGWVVLALGGWGVTQWLGEPVATEGPGPSRPPASGVGPESGPEHASDGACGSEAATAAAPTPHASVPAAPLLVVCVRTD
ncbi:hypothetical protein [Streptomyces sp. NBC_00316]|uniref:hypothetical protein n=1 Tax=Streptomyces sp. NBC_00316 TaxID=2975710 RepID=UPI002E2A852B|nr:hypothetical protein [Streptomyces sp. NBC_00316]